MTDPDPKETAPGKKRHGQRLILSGSMVAVAVAGYAWVTRETSSEARPTGDTAPLSSGLVPTRAPQQDAAMVSPTVQAPSAQLYAAPHGAMNHASQLAMVLALLDKTPPGTPPPWLPPARWLPLFPTDNPLSPARVALGRKLYFDPRLSRDGTVACATCHDTSRGFSDRRATSEGISGQIGRRNAPTTMNSMFYATQFWDGRAATLEEQAKLPVTNPIEMGHPSGEAAIQALGTDREYVKMFAVAYGRAPNFADLSRAIASFERTLVFLQSPFDRYLAGDQSAMDEDAKAGWTLYNGKARCQTCHELSNEAPLGVDSKFHNIGISARHADFDALTTKALGALANDTPSERSIDSPYKPIFRSSGAS